MTAKRLVAAGALLAAAITLAGPASAACKFEKAAEVPVTMQGTQPIVTAKLNGQDAKFMIDTGDTFGVVSPETAQQYKMKRSIAPFGAMVRVPGGEQRRLEAVAANTFSFGGAGFHDVDFILAARPAGSGVAGAIGENLMGPFDVEYDFANGVIRYFKPEGCGYDANLAYWSQGMSVSRLSIIEPTNILLKVIVNAKVDGRTIRVKFDSGSYLSLLSRTAARRAGIEVSSEGVSSAGVTYGAFGKGLESFLAPFASFQIGDEEIKNTQLRVADLELPDSDMMLGADFFLSHRILISNSQKRVYFTYNGGPVFKMDAPRRPQVAEAAGSGAGPATGPGAGGPGADAPDGPKTAADFARRAAAEAARREFQLAIADYTRAIALEPDNGKHYRARGMIRLVARQPVLAMADLDEALKRDPNDPEALMRRGELYLASRDTVRGRADFEAAKALAPTDSNLVVQAGNAYTRAGEFEPAIHELDLWVAAHPKADDLPQILGARCFARAAWGKELDVGLADCDAALKRDKVSTVMESRGLILLRQGRLDEAIAQYAAAIKAQPRAAVALYGRGVAELKKGARTEGDADIAAAKAITPTIAEQFKRLGVAPDDSAAAKPAA
jgi:tetratricopeptide (TPR) repeat protein/predicted aspartyl protease